MLLQLTLLFPSLTEKRSTEALDVAGTVADRGARDAYASHQLTTLDLSQSVG
jgi:hypothetical protein